MSNPIHTEVVKDGVVSSEIQTSSGKSSNPSQAFIKQCLHPPSAVPDFAGLPTNDARSQALAQFVNLELMNRPVIKDKESGKTVVTEAVNFQEFDVGFLMPNGGRVLSIGFVNNSTFNNSMLQDFANVMVQENYDFKAFSHDAQLYRTCYKSTTFTLNATHFNDTGLVAGNQFNPNIMFAGNLLSFANEQPMSFADFVRDNHKARHFSTVKPSLVTSDHPWFQFPMQVRSDVLRKCGLNSADVLDLDPNTNIQVINFGWIADNSDSTNAQFPSLSQIMQQSRRSYGGPAKDGAFSVQRLNTTQPTWCSAGNTNNTNFGLYQCYAYVGYTVGVVSGLFYALYDNIPPGVDDFKPYILLDTLWTKDMTFSWVEFRGLSLNSTVSSSVLTQLINKKVYTGFEIQPSLRSAWAGQMRLGPRPDIMAMQALLEGFYDLKDVLPAKYNAIGTLGSLLLTAGDLLMSYFKGRQSGPDMSNNKQTKKPASNNRVKQLEKKVQNLSLRAPAPAPRPANRMGANQRRTMGNPVKPVNKSKPRNRRRKRAAAPAPPPTRPKTLNERFGGTNGKFKFD
jgi:hypothetical protein